MRSGGVSLIMTILPLFRVLTALLIPLGQIGLWVAMVGAIALAIALAVDAAGLVGGGAVLWLTGAMLSLGLWYSGDLMAPVAVAVALVVAVAAGLACRRLLRRRPGAVRNPVVRRGAESARPPVRTRKVALPDVELASLGAPSDARA